MNRKLGILLLLLVVFVAMGAAAAVDPIDSGRDVDIEANSIEEINTKFSDGSTVQSGDTIYLGNKTFSSTYNSQNPLITINVDNIVVNGGTSSNPDAYSTFKSDYPLLGVTSSNVTFINIRFSQNYYYQGSDSYSSIDSNGYIKFINCSFDSIKSTAIDVNSATNLEVMDCAFTNIESTNNLINFNVVNNFICLNNNFNTVNAGTSWAPKDIMAGTAKFYNISNNKFYNIKSTLFDFSTGSSTGFNMSGNNFTKVEMDNDVISIGTVAGEFVCHDNIFSEITAGNQWGGVKPFITGTADSYRIYDNNFTDITGNLFVFSAQSSEFLLYNNIFDDVSSANNPTINIGDVTGDFSCHDNVFYNVAAEMYGGYNTVVIGTAGSYNIYNNNFTDIDGGLFDFSGQASDFTVKNNNFINITAPGKPVIGLGEVTGEFVCYNNDFINVSCEQYGSYYKIITGTAGSYNISECNFKDLKGSLFEFTNEATKFVLDCNNFTGIEAGNNPIMDVAADSYEIYNCNFNNLNAILFEFGASQSDRFILQGNNFTNLISANSVVSIGEVTEEFVCKDNDFINVNSGTKPLVEGSAGSYEISNCNFNNLTTSLFNFNGESSKFVLDGNDFINITSSDSVVTFGKVTGEFISVGNDFINVNSGNKYLVEGTANSYNISDCNFKNLKGQLFEFSDAASKFVLEGNNFINITSENAAIVDFGEVSGDFICHNNDFVNLTACSPWGQYFRIIEGTADSYNISDCNFKNLKGIFIDCSSSPSTSFILDNNNITNITSNGNDIINLGTVTGEFVFTNNDVSNISAVNQYGQYKNIVTGSAGSYNISDCNFYNITGGLLNFDGESSKFIFENNNFTLIESDDSIIAFGNVANDFKCYNNDFVNVSAGTKYILAGTADSYNISDCNFNNLTGIFIDSSANPSSSFILENSNFTNFNSNGNNIINFGVVTGDFVCHNNRFVNMSASTTGPYPQYKYIVTGSADTYDISDCVFNNLTGALFTFNGTDSSSCTIENNNFTYINSPRANIINFGNVTGDFVCVDNNFENLVCHDISAGLFYNTLLGTAKHYLIENSTFSLINGSVLKFVSGENLDVYNTTFQNLKFRDPILNFTIDGMFMCENNTFSNLNSSNFVIEGTGDSYHVDDCNFRNVNAGLVNFGEGTKCEIYDINIKTVNLDNNLIQSNCKNSTIRDCSFANVKLNGHTLIKLNSNATNSNIFNLSFSKCKDGEGIIVESNYTSISDTNFVGFDSETNGGAIILRGYSDLVEGCNFSDCYSGQSGGAIGIGGFGNSTVNNCIFTNITAWGSGGAIIIRSPNAFINNSIFIDNNSTENSADDSEHDGGGAICVDRDNPNCLIANCYFENNTGTNSGGAIRIATRGSSIVNCTFIGNYVETGTNIVEYGGGAIWAAWNTITINNSAFYFNQAPYGGAIRGAANMDNCIFVNNTATDGNGGGIDLTIDDQKISIPYVKNCLFYNNTALGKYNNDDRAQGGGLHTWHLEAFIVENCTFINNTAFRGGGLDLLLVNESYIYNNTFNNNYAIIGGGIDLVGDNAILRDNNITENVALRGAGIQIQGNNASIFDCYIAYNVANSGGGIWISGADTNITDTLIEFNEAIMGGAIYKYGEVLNMTNVTIHHNTAILNTSNNVSELLNFSMFESYDFKIEVDGYNTTVYYTFYEDNVAQEPLFITFYGALGGGIYTEGSRAGNSIIINCLFYHNTARNGSAIYVDAYHMNIDNSSFYSNCAWSYALPINFNSTTINLGETLKGNVTLIGGDNLINAIYNTRVPTIFDLNNVTYEFYNGTDVVNRTTVFDTPVSGWENSDNGNRIYQDDCENNQIINIKITNEAGDVIYETSGRSDIAGNVYFETPADLPAGNYYISAVHENGLPDNLISNYYYTDIDNATSFAIIPPNFIDIIVNKQANVSKVEFGEFINWTIVVKNNGTVVASDVVLGDLLPEGLEFVSAGAGYDDVTGVWNIGDLDAGATVVMNIITKAVKLGNITNVAIVNTTSNDVNLSNNRDNDTVEVTFVDLIVIKDANVSAIEMGETVNWTITVKNNGTMAAKDVVVGDLLPDGLEFVSAGAGYDDVTGVWNIGDLDAGESVSISIVTKAVKLGNITNVAIVNTTSNDVNLSNNRDNDTVGVVMHVDVSIVKNVNVSIVYTGETITWTITVANNGPHNATDVVVEDFLPEGLEFVSASADYNKTTGIWTVGDLNSGESVVLTVVTKVIAIEAANITNVATVNTTSNDTNLSNNRDNDTVKVLPIVDVAVVKEVNATTVFPRDLVSWTIIVTNNEISTAENVVVLDVLPNGVEYVSSISEMGEYANGNWIIGNLHGGETVKLVIVTKVSDNAVSNITNVAIVTTSSNDTNPENDRDNATINIGIFCDVAVNITVNQSIVRQEEVLSWTFNITNYGPSLAENTQISINLPDGVDFKEVIVPENTHFDNETHVWTVGDLAKDQNLTLIIITDVKSDSTGILNATTNISTSTPDIDLDNNKDHDKAIIILPVIDLEITKKADSPTYVVGDKIFWTLEVQNTGNIIAYNVIVNDILPNGVRFIEFTATKGTYENGVWTIGDLDGDERATLTICCEAVTAGEITNLANVTTTSNEISYTNNHANSTVVVDEIENPVEPNITDENATDKNIMEKANNHSINKEVMLSTGNPLFALLVLFVLPILIYKRRKE